LELLVVHSYADLVAVGPGVATDWKVNLTEDLYRRTRRYFDSGNLPGSPDDPEMELMRAKVRSKLQDRNSSPFCFELLDRLPLSLLDRCDPSHLADEIEMARRSKEGLEGTLCTCQYDPRFKAMRYTVIRREGIRSIGTFARATGALSASGLTIMRAQIETVDDVAWDYFWVIDPTSPNQVATDSRSEQICRRVCHLLDSPNEPLPPYRRKWATQEEREPDTVNVLPTKVVFDNDTVDRYTILSFFAYDEVGLLYRIAATLAENRVVLHFAKIDTHLDQVADVFYVSELDGSKLSDPERLRRIRDALMAITTS
jgi:[protein-PII] uridylyltransferase